MLLAVAFIGFSGLSFSKEKFYIPNDEDIAIVDKFYAEKKYARAFPMYDKLAKSGDKYSQYRLSAMHFLGLGTDKNFELAYSWARIAKSSNNPHFVNYFEQITKQVTPDIKETVEKTFRELNLQFNDLVVSERFLKHLKEDFPKCTGSRLRSIHACSKISVMCEGWLPMGGSQSYLPPSQECKDFLVKINPKNLRAMSEAIHTLELKVKTLRMRRGIVTIKEDS